MVTSTMVKPTVEVAFTGTDTSPTWTDITAYVRNVGVDRGRNREVDQFDAGKLRIELKNADRRFDPEHASGPYYGNLLPMRPVRVRATYSAVTYDVFRGYIDGWPQGYKVPKYGYSMVTATDAMKVLTRQDIISTFSTAMLADDPDHWYPLSDPVGSFVVTDIGSDPVTGAAAGGDFGAGSIVSTDSGTAFQIDELFENFVQIQPGALTATTFTVEIWFRKALMVAPNGTITLVSNFQGGGVDINKQFYCVFDDGGYGLLGQLFIYIGDAAEVSSAGRLDDDETHLLSVVCTATTADVYLDGVSIGSDTRTTDTIQMPLNLGEVGLGLAGALLFNGDLTMQHVFVWDGTALTSTQIADHYAAGGDGYSGDLSGARVTRILDQIAWPATLRTIDTGDITLGSAPVGGSSTALTLLRQVDATEGGGLYIDEAGKITFRDRSAQFSETRSITSQATFGDAAGELDYHDVEFAFDEALVRNYVTGQRQGGATQVASDATSRVTYYTMSHSRGTTIELNDEDVKNACEFIVANYKDAATRITKLEVRPQRNPASLWPQVLGRKIGDRITVKRRPQGVGAVISKELIIEGISHTVTPESWVTEFAVSNVLGETPTITGYLILNDATRGVLNSNRVM